MHRLLANRSSNIERKATLSKLAETWETLARDREAHLLRQVRIAALEEPSVG